MERENKVKEKYEKPKLKAHRINLFFLACCNTGGPTTVASNRTGGACCKSIKKPKLLFY